MQTEVQVEELQLLRRSIIACERCPRLRSYCIALGETKRRAYMDWDYWAKPVPGFGDPDACVLILGLAPGAHGANRTGRLFTGDKSGDFLYPVLYESGFATQPNATSSKDGLELRSAWIASILRCAPPQDKPAPQELRNCSEYLRDELRLLTNVRAVVCLGRLAWDRYFAQLVDEKNIERRSAYVFGHGAEYALPHGVTAIGSFHPSLRNTNTGKLNRAMFLRIFVRARACAGLD